MFACLLLILVVAAVTAEVSTEVSRLPADCQRRLDGYLTDTFGPGMPAVLSIDRAQKPSSLTPELTDVAFDNSRLTHLWFPPEEVWCVLLRPESMTAQNLDEEAPDFAVFMALHIDLYNAGWVVHRISRKLAPSAVPEILATIGCSLGTSTGRPGHVPP
jgi:hypothetical protein